MAVALLLLAAAAAVLAFLWILRSPSSRVLIKGRHVFITGGSSGIGLEIAKLVVSEGARKVTLLARGLEGLRKARQEILDSCPGGTTDVSIESADVVDYRRTEEAIHNAGDIDVLVCSHGLSIPCAFEDASLEDLHKVVDVNFKGTMNVIKAALPGMKSNGGAHARSVALFSSQAGQAGLYGYSSYSGTKAALRMFAEGFRQEVLGYKIQVSVIYPPDTNTPGFAQENKTKPEVTKTLSASSRAMEAVDVARMSLQGIKDGRFTVPCNFDGHLLAIASAGMSPQTSVFYSLLEIACAPVARVIALCVLRGWYGTIGSFQKKRKLS